VSAPITRRQFVVGAGSTALVAGCGRLPWQGQSATKVYRVGYLASDAAAPEHEAFRQGLRELGYVEGQNITLEYRWAERNEQLTGLAADLVGLPVDVVVAAAGVPSALAAKQGTSIVPIVFTQSPDPVATGLVESLARPGGNITGLSVMGAQLNGKRLESLKAVLPHVSRVAYVYASGPAGLLTEQEAQAAGQVLGIKLLSAEVRDANDIPGALEEAVKGRADALWPDGSLLLMNQRAQILDFAAKHRLPVLAQFREYVEAGALMSYGASRIANYHRAAYYVDRILKGTPPADLPVEQPMTFEFVVNMKTARELGITFPHEVALQITEVIE
jgi:putative ABC transport system substrate-binding protein